ncbi:MAG TPA: hypothetical protein VKH41_11835 [Myxococcota bacterium]|nr:hypothetical protein [Myxococcota bacterium]
MRSFQVFAAMSPEEAERMLRVLSKESPAMFRQAVDAAAMSIKARPVFLRRQPFELRAKTIRRSLARVATNLVADELLAIYFLECRKPLLLEWLDLLGLPHEDGTLKDESPSQPPESELAAAVAKYRGAGDDPDRELLLRAFGAQSAIEWPALDALLGFGE